MRYAHGVFESFDHLRRLQGAMLERMGFGPHQSPYELIGETAHLRLRCYARGQASEAPLLIVPAPIKQAYIWDLSPERSVVRQAVQHGLGVYLVEWIAPFAGQAQAALQDYCGPMLDTCLDLIQTHTGADRAVLAGHSLGGIFAALYSAYRPQRVAALILIEVPLHFPSANGPAPLHDLGTRAAQAGRMPGSLLSMLSTLAAPGTFGAERHIDHLASLGSPERLQTHWQVERWSMDEFPMSLALFEDLAVQLYQCDSFMRGSIRIKGATLHPSNIEAPLFAVFEPTSTIIPAESVRAFARAAGSAQKELVAYPGDTGVALQHVGPLVGDNAHRHLWPRIFSWIDRVTTRGA